MASLFARFHNRYAVLTHQTSDTTVTDIQADLFQFFGHAWPAITAQTETGLLLDVGQRDQTGPLSATGRSIAERNLPTKEEGGDTFDPAHYDIAHIAQRLGNDVALVPLKHIWPVADGPSRR